MGRNAFEGVPYRTSTMMVFIAALSVSTQPHFAHAAGPITRPASQPASQSATDQVRELRKAAEAGNGSAMWELGKMYQTGQGGLPKDPAEAARWYRKGADAGNTGAMGTLGAMYRFGDGGLKKDPAEAIKWFTKAADLGNPAAMARLGEMYMYGIGVRPDPARAARLYEKASDLGDPMAMKEIGLANRHNKHFETAVNLLQKSADAGDVEAMIALGEMCQAGQGLPRDREAAIGWYRKAAQNGDAMTKRQATEHLRALGIRDESTGTTTRPARSPATKPR
jgi:TPR repeat protein